MRKTLTALALGGALAATGCSGTDKPAATPVGPTSDSPAASATVAVTPQSMAEKLSCTFEPETADQTELYVKEQGSCDFASRPVTLYTFSGSGTRDSWLQVAESFGGNYAVGDRWVVRSDQADAAADAAALLDGKVR